MKNSKRGFGMVSVLAATLITGVMVAVAVPSVIQMHRQAEEIQKVNEATVDFTNELIKAYVDGSGDFAEKYSLEDYIQGDYIPEEIIQ